METAFQIANLLVFPQWMLMIFVPQWKGTQWLVKSYLVPAFLACMYAYYIFSGAPLDFQDFSNFSGIKNLFAKGGDTALLAGWIHYLAFDLVAGSAVFQDAQQKNIPHRWIVLPLLFCFMLGPVGLLMYWLVRLFKTKRMGGEN